MKAAIKPFFFLTLLVICKVGIAQAQVGRYQILDSLTQRPVPFTIVKLLDAGNKKALLTLTADGNGEFSLDRAAIKSNDLRIRFEMLGYRQTESHFLFEGPKVFYLNIAPAQLNEISIRSAKKLIGVENNKLVYFVSRDSLHNKGNLSTALRQIPGVDVTLTGSVKIADKRVLYMMNGEESAMVRDGRSFNALPAKYILKVELITNPDPKYLERGYDLIMNVITTADFIEGSLGSFTIGYNTRNAPTANFSYFYRKNRFSVNLYNGYSEDKYAIRQSTTATTNGNTSLLTSDADQVRRADNAALDLNYSQKNSLIFIYGGYSYMNTFRNSLTDYQPAGTSGHILTNGQLVNRLLKYTAGGGIRLYKISSITNGSVGVSFSNSPITNRLNNFSPQADSTNLGSSNESWRETVVQADLTTKFSKTLAFDYGLQGAFRNYRSGYAERTMVPPVTSTLNAGETEYQQSIRSGFVYLKISPSKRLSINSGVRVEHSVLSNDQDPLFGSKTYLNFLPRVFLAYKVGDSHVINLKYRLNIKRPSFYYLSNFVNSSDNLLTTSGNGSLKPELFHTLSLDYNLYLNKLYLRPEYYTSLSTNSIQQVAVRDGNTFRYTYQNDGRSSLNALYLNFGGTVAKFIQFNVNSAVGYSSVRLNDLSSDRFFYTFSFSNTYELKHEFKIQLSGFLNSPTVQPQGYVTGTNMMTLSLSKSFARDRYVLVGSLDDPLFKDRTFINDIYGPAYDLRSRQIRSSRLLSISFFYRFGKLKPNYFVSGSKTSSDDLKAVK